MKRMYCNDNNECWMEIEAMERWLERPWFERFNAEILDAACAASNAIARAIYIQPTDNDIEF